MLYLIDIINICEFWVWCGELCGKKEKRGEIGGICETGMKNAVKCSSSSVRIKIKWLVWTWWSYLRE